MAIELFDFNKLDKKGLFERNRHLESKNRVYRSALMTSFVLIDVIKLKLKTLESCKDMYAVMPSFINSIKDDIYTFENAMKITGLYEKPINSLEELDLWLDKLIVNDNLH